MLPEIKSENVLCYESLLHRKVKYVVDKTDRPEKNKTSEASIETGY